MDNCTWLVFLVFIQGVYCTNLFTGTDGMKKLSAAEGLVVDDLQDVADQMESRILIMKFIIEDIKRLKQRQDELDVAGHPVQAYNLIKRWRHIQTFLGIGDNIKSKQDEQTQIPVEIGCRDEHPSCKKWSLEGECQNNAKYMLAKCQESCKVCRRFRREDSPVIGVCEKLKTISKVAIPDNSDYEGACQGLVRLQRTYRLDTESLISGNIRGHMSAQSLKHEDFYYIGKEAVGMMEWGYAAQWLQRAMYYNREYSLVGLIHVHLAKAYIGLNDTIRANSVILKALGGHKPVITHNGCVDQDDRCERWAKEGECDKNPRYMKNYCKYSCSECAPGEDTVPEQTLLTNIYASLQRKVAEFGADHTRPEPKTERTVLEDQDWKPQYEKLCRGKGTKTYHDAVCRLRPSPLPYYVYKEEILCMNPRIAMVYDVINDRESDFFRNVSYNQMKRGQVGSDRRYTNDRVSKVGWLPDHHNAVRRVSERIEMITGLECTIRTPQKDGPLLMSSDEMQVVNYGIGGHYEPHTDYFQFVSEDEKNTDIAKTVMSSGDRLATFLMYLSHVEAGGGTVYPRAKIFVPPVKNAAAFWFNAEMSGRYDPLTLHAGCPILLGEKWVANKWIREYGNEFTRRCALSPDAKYS